MRSFKGTGVETPSERQVSVASVPQRPSSPATPPPPSARLATVQRQPRAINRPQRDTAARPACPPLRWAAERLVKMRWGRSDLPAWRRLPRSIGRPLRPHKFPSLRPVIGLRPASDGARRHAIPDRKRNGRRSMTPPGSGSLHMGYPVGAVCAAPELYRNIAKYQRLKRKTGRAAIDNWILIQNGYVLLFSYVHTFTF